MPPRSRSPLNLPPRLAAPLLAAALLAGCAGFPDAGPRLARTDPAALGASEAAIAWPSGDWWLQYDDPVLSGLIAKALADNPSLRIALARQDKALANAGVAESNLWPRLDADIDSTRRRFSAHGEMPPPLAGAVADMNRARLNGAWEIDFFGRNRAALDAALGQARAAEADARAARNLLAADVARRYFKLAALFEQRAIAEATLKQRRDIYALVQRRVAAGLDTGVELKQAEGAVPDIRRDLGSVDEQIALTRHALAALTGQPASATAELAPRLGTVPMQPLPGSLPADLIGRRPDLVAARWRVEAAIRNTDAAKAAFYPNINLIGLAGFSSIGFANWSKGDSREWGLGAALHLPIFDAGRLRASLRGAAADTDEAVASYNATLIEALREVADDIASQQAVERQLQEQAQALRAAEAAYELARQRYAGGLGNYLTVLSAETGVLTQRRIASDLKARHIDNNVLLIRALGGGYAAG